MESDPDAVWRDYFANWPQDLQRRGVVVTAFGEQIPFEGFMTTARLLLLERKAPDTLGARTVILPFEMVQAVKLVDVTKPTTFTKIGFVGSGLRAAQ